jgi:hypothetical protein
MVLDSLSVVGGAVEGLVVSADAPGSGPAPQAARTSMTARSMFLRIRLVIKDRTPPTLTGFRLFANPLGSCMVLAGLEGSLSTRGGCIVETMLDSSGDPA